MNQYANFTDIISMEIFNLEVVYLDRLSELFLINGIDISFSAVQQFKLITNYQILGCNPTLSLYKEGMPHSGGNGFAIYL